MSKKFKQLSLPRHLLLDKIKKIIVQFLDEHETDICYEDMSLEIVKQTMADALAEKLIDNGAEITYPKATKKNDGKRKT